MLAELLASEVLPQNYPGVHCALGFLIENEAKLLPVIRKFNRLISNLLIVLTSKDKLLV